MNNQKGTDKKGVFLTTQVTIIISVIVLAIFLGTIIYQEVTADKTGEGAREWIVGITPEFAEGVIHNFLLEGSTGNFFGGTIGKTRDILGFNEGAWEFGQYLFTGLFVGLWLWVVFLLASLERLVALIPVVGKTIASATSGGRYVKNLQNSWLGIIADRWHKMIMIAVGYAVIMQIPLLNSFIKIVTFEFLLGSTGMVWGALMRSFIIAFYIGFLPTAIEQYSRYKIRKGYYHAVEREKAIMTLDKIRAGN